MTAPGLDLTRWIRPGDTVLWGQGTGEPRTLTEALVAQRARLGGIRVFLGATFSTTLAPEHADHLTFAGIGGVGNNAALAGAGVLDVLPCHLSTLPHLLATGRLPADVVLLQVSPADASGRHPLGLVADYLPAAIGAARTVIAEVNDQVPATPGATVDASEIDHMVSASRPPVMVDSAPPDEVDERIGALVASLVPDGATIQLGIGAVPAAVAHALRGKVDLGVHSGAVGDWLVDLTETGAVTNIRKPVDRGVSVTGALYGTRRLYDWADRNRGLALRPADHTHAPDVLARLPGLVAVNSAVEVDLTGQINAEVVGGHHIGTVGGQVDFVRAAVGSPDGRSIIALRSTARGGTVSRLVPTLGDGVVTTARSDADVVVTEHGVADLRGAPLAERASRLIAIAAPRFRDELTSWLRAQPNLC